MSDRVFAVIWLAFCAAAAWMAWQIEAPFSYEPIGPRAFPLLLAAAMALSSVWLLARPGHGADWPRGELRGKVALLLAAFVGYAFLFEPLGFPVATALSTLVIGRIFGGRWVACVVAGVAMGGGLYFFFDTLLDVTLPLGRLWAGA